MYNPLELAITNMWNTLKVLQLGSTFSQNTWKYNADGSIATDANGFQICEVVQRQGYIEKIAPYSVTLQALVEEYGVQKSAIGVKYLGGTAKPFDPEQRLNVGTYMDNPQGWAYKLEARFSVMGVLMRATKQSDKIAGWTHETLSDKSTMDILQDVHLLLEGKIVTPGSTPLIWLGHQTPVEISNQNKAYGAVVFGSQYKTTITIPIMRPQNIEYITNINLAPYTAEKHLAKDVETGFTSVEYTEERQ